MNAINAVFPYQHNGMWVFDDESVGLRQEPFVSGADEVIDLMVAQVPNAEEGFRLLFSASPFPGHQYNLCWVREEYVGNWYHCEELGLEGWLCPALLHYFPEPPKRIYARVEPKRE